MPQRLFLDSKKILKRADIWNLNRCFKLPTSESKKKYPKKYHTVDLWVTDQPNQKVKSCTKYTIHNYTFVMWSKLLSNWQFLGVLCNSSPTV